MAADAGSGALLVHATCVAIAGRAALLRGAPGSGKSDLALRFISLFDDSGAQLVADDQVQLAREGGAVIARGPEAIAGKLEVRGVGIVEVPRCPHAPLVLIAEMAAVEDVPRLPPDPLPGENVLGLSIPVLGLAPFEASAPVKLKLALTGGL